MLLSFNGQIVTEDRYKALVYLQSKFKEITIINQWLGLINDNQMTVKVKEYPRHIFKWYAKLNEWHCYSVWANEKEFILKCEE